METGDSRSRDVIEGYKRHKIASSALRRVRDLLQEFERERATDRKFALVGMTLLLLLLVYLGFDFFSSQSVIIP